MHRSDDLPGSGTGVPALDYVASSRLPMPWAIFDIHAFVERDTGKEHIALTLGDLGTYEPVLARIHSECLTGDALFSQRCDCGAQLERSEEHTSELQSLMRISYAVFCLKKKTHLNTLTNTP